MLRWIIKWGFRTALVTTLLVAALLLLRNVIVRLAAEYRVAEWTGLETLVGSARLELTQSRVSFRDVRVKNPPGVGNRPFLDVPLLVVDYDLEALLFRQVRLRHVSAQISEINLMRRDAGHSTQATLEARLTAANQPGATPFGPFTFVGLDRLQLAVGKYSYIDYYQMQQSRELDLGVTNAMGSNIASLASLTRTLQRLATEKGVKWPPSDSKPAAPPPPRR